MQRGVCVSRGVRREFGVRRGCGLWREEPVGWGLGEGGAHCSVPLPRLGTAGRHGGLRPRRQVRVHGGSGCSRISVWLGHSGPCQPLGRPQDPLSGTSLAACLGAGMKEQQS